MVGGTSIFPQALMSTRLFHARKTDGYSGFEHLFDESGAFDLELVQRDVRGVLDVCSQAAVFIE